MSAGTIQLKKSQENTHKRSIGNKNGGESAVHSTDIYVGTFHHLPDETNIR